MAVKYLGNTISGSNSEKPTLTANEVGVLYLATDTGKIFHWDGDSWEETTLTDAAVGNASAFKGVASFNSDNFASASGSITIKDGGVILGTETTGNYVATVAGTANEVDVSASTGAVTIGLPSDVTIGQDLVVTRNLTVSGTTVTANVDNLTIEDPLLYLANGQSSSPAFDSGFVVERGNTTNVAFIWDESLDEFAVANVPANEVGTTAGNVTIDSYADLKVGKFTVDNITIDGNTISSTNTNGNITIAANGTGDLLYTGTGHVGIGIAEPDLGTGRYLTVSGTGNEKAKLALVNPSVSNGSAIGNVAFYSATTDFGGIAYALDSGSTTAGNMKFYTATSSSPVLVMTMDSDADVGIGVADPAGYKLNIYDNTSGKHAVWIQNPSTASGANSELIIGTTVSDNILKLGSGYRDDGDWGNAWVYADGKDLALKTDQKMDFYTGGAAAADIAMTITAAGDVGIGQASADYVLDVTANNTDWATWIENTNANGYGLTIRAGSSGKSALDIRAQSGSSLFSIDGDGTNVLGDLTVTGDAVINNGSGLVIGHTAHVTVGDTSEVQILGTTASDSQMAIVRYTNSKNAPARLILAQSNVTTLAADAVVEDDSKIGFLDFVANDGSVNFSTVIARIGGEVDDAAPATSDIGGALVFSVASGTGVDSIGSGEAMRIAADGTIAFSGEIGIKGANNGESIITLGTATLPAYTDGPGYIQFKSTMTTVQGGNVGYAAWLWLNGGMALGAGSDTYTVVASAYIDEPNITLNGNTVTNAATLWLENAPTEGTNNYSLWVGGGLSRFDGNILLKSTDAGATGPIIQLYHDTSSAAVGDRLGVLDFLDTSGTIFGEISVDLEGNTSQAGMHFKLKGDATNDKLYISRDGNATLLGSLTVGGTISKASYALMTFQSTAGFNFQYDTASTYLQIAPEDAGGDVAIRYRASAGAAPDLIFKNDAGTVRATLTNTGKLILPNGGGQVIGHTAQFTSANNETMEFQIHGTDAEDAQGLIGAWGTTPGLRFYRSNQTTIGGSRANIVDGNIAMNLHAMVDNGTTDYQIASLMFVVDGTNPHSSTRVPGAFRFITEDGSDNYSERMRLTPAGSLKFSQASTISTSTGILTIDGDDGIVLNTTGSGGITLSELVYFNDGSVSAPSIANTGDTNTGIYFPAADTVGITASGTLRAKFEASQVTFPNISSGALIFDLDSVTGNSNNANTVLRMRAKAANDRNAAIEFYNDTTKTALIGMNRDSDIFTDSSGGEAGSLVIGTAEAKLIGFYTNATLKMTILSDGKVGIGVTPTSTLHVVGDAQVDNLNINGNIISSTSTNGAVTLDPHGTGDVRFWLAGVGKVDVDKSNSIDPLHIVNSGNSTRGTSIKFRARNAADSEVAMYQAFDPENQKMHFGPNNFSSNEAITSPTLTVDATNGRVGVNNSTPVTTFDVVGSVGINNELDFAPDESADNLVGYINFRGYNGGLDTWRDLQIYNGKGQGATGRIASFDGSAGTVNFTGAITAASYADNSDRRVKTNIQTLSSALDKITQLRGVSFDYLWGKKESKIGLIAQEVESIIPEVVSVNSESLIINAGTSDEEELTDVKAISYGNLVAYLIEAIKELKVEIDELKKS